MDRLDEAEEYSNAIAVIGMAGRFPGSPTVSDLWRNLCAGVESIKFYSRAELLSAGVSPELMNRPDYVPAFGMLEGFEWFDAAFFGMTPREAELTDPQHRLFLECAWESLESAGYDPRRYAGLISVFGGCGANQYGAQTGESRIIADRAAGVSAAIAGDRDFFATRVSYKLDLKGPSLTVQTACSTSLTAVVMACQSLQSYQCDMALAGASSVHLDSQFGYLSQEGFAASKDGHCRPFDANASGTVGGDGVAIVVLKRMQEAITDGDTILAVIKGTAINNDGAGKIGFAAPSAQGQARAIAAALTLAGVSPETIGYVEAHGTGTTLGDPIEVEALSDVFRHYTKKQRFCALGSLKANIGHLNTVAGVAGLIKTVLCLRHGQLVPSINFTTPNPRLRLERSPFYVNTTLQDWLAVDGMRRAAVSAFGIGGTNAHIVLEQAPSARSATARRRSHLLVLSAKTSSALEAMRTRLADHLEQHVEIELADVAYTLQVGRQEFKHRLTLVCATREAAIVALRSGTGLRTGEAEQNRRPVFMFTGQGGGYVGMGQSLYEAEPLFRKTIDHCADHLKSLLGVDLRQVLYPDTARTAEAQTHLESMPIAMAAVFVVQVALGKLWLSWGIHPETMIGLSLGEFAVATLAEVMELDAALTLVAMRGKLSLETLPGAMLSVPLSAKEVHQFLDSECSIAVESSPSSCVVSGPPDRIAALQSVLSQRSVEAQILPMRGGSHSRLMAPMAVPFRRLLEAMTLRPPRIPYIAGLHGNRITAEEATSSSYWIRHLCEKIDFTKGIKTLLADEAKIFLEIGPGRTLCSLVKQHGDVVSDCLRVASLRGQYESQHDDLVLLESLGSLWLKGVKVDWDGFQQGELRRRVPLPSYPFERKRYWLSQIAEPVSSAAAQTVRPRDPRRWLYVPAWQKAMPVSPLSGVQPGAQWLVFADRYGFGKQAGKMLRELGCRVVLIEAGCNFEEREADLWSIDPAQQSHYQQLMQALAHQTFIPRYVMHCWNLRDDFQLPDLERCEEQQNFAFFSPLFLSQALTTLALAEKVTITFITNGMQSLHDEILHCPEQATVLGPTRVIPQEYEGVDCRSIDLPFDVLRSAEFSQAIRWLIAEQRAETSDPVVAYRLGERWRLGFEQAPTQRVGAKVQRLRPRGVYLIIGGLGGIGLELAKFLAKSVNARLILTTRSPFPPRSEWARLSAEEGESPTAAESIGTTLHTLMQLESLGADVRVVQADVCDLDAMKSCVETAVREFETIHGVIHAAGVPAGGAALTKTFESAWSILAPKIRGTLVLEHVLRDFQLDLFIVCSSLNSVLGEFGQVDHCAASSFLDAWAIHRSQHSKTFVASIDWDGWAEIGGAARAAARNSQRRAGSSPHGAALPALSKNQPLERSFLFHVATDWLLKEHALDGRATLPAMAYPELIIRSLAKQLPLENTLIRELWFLSPFTPPHGSGFLRAQDAVHLDVHELCFVSQTDSDIVIEHARCSVDRNSDVAPRQLDIASIMNRCSARDMRLLKTRHGPRWHSLKAVWESEDSHDALAIIELPYEYADDLNHFRIHPAMLDVATGFSAARLVSAYRPFALHNVQLYASFPARIYSYCSQSPNRDAASSTLDMSITIADSAGKILMTIEHYLLRRVHGAA